jgi:hypothetical protein
MPGGYAREKQNAEIGNGGGGEKEPVNSTIPNSPLYTFSVKERGLRRGERSGSGSPLTGRETKNYRATHEMVRAQIEVTYSSIWPLTSRRRQKIKDQFDICIYSKSIKYGDFRKKDDIKEDKRMAPTIQVSIEETTPEKHSTIASGATTIRSAECAPDEIIITVFRVEV